MDRHLRLGVERDGHLIILVPTSDLRELGFEEMEEDATRVLELLEQGEVRSVVFDFENTEYYGSTALGFFVKLWKRVKAADGQMAFCNVSQHEMEILRLTRLDSVWPICETRDEALAAIRRHDASRE